jgi:hypothetical protein
MAEDIYININIIKIEKRSKKNRDDYILEEFLRDKYLFLYLIYFR